jgi:hypothetical protein
MQPYDDPLQEVATTGTNFHARWLGWTPALLLVSFSWLFLAF